MQRERATRWLGPAGVKAPLTANWLKAPPPGSHVTNNSGIVSGVSGADNPFIMHEELVEIEIRRELF